MKTTNEVSYEMIYLSYDFHNESKEFHKPSFHKICKISNM